MKYKTCKDCGKAKPMHTHFRRNLSYTSNYENTCKDCANQSKHDQNERKKHWPINNLLRKWGRT